MELSKIDSLIEIMKNKGVSQKELTDYLGISQSQFSSWKSGQSSSYLKYIARISEFLNVTPNEILGQKNKPTTNGELNPTTAQIVELLERLTPEEQKAAAEFLRLLADS